MFSSSGSFCSPSAPRWFPSESVLFQEISMNKLVAGRATSIFHLCAVAKFAGDSSQASPKVAPSCRTSTLSKENTRSLSYSTTELPDGQVYSQEGYWVEETDDGGNDYPVYRFRGWRSIITMGGMCLFSGHLMPICFLSVLGSCFPLPLATMLIDV